MYYNICAYAIMFRFLEIFPAEGINRIFRSWQRSLLSMESKFTNQCLKSQGNAIRITFNLNDLIYRWYFTLNKKRLNLLLLENPVNALALLLCGFLKHHKTALKGKKKMVVKHIVSGLFRYCIFIFWKKHIFYPFLFGGFFNPNIYLTNG